MANINLRWPYNYGPENAGVTVNILANGASLTSFPAGTSGAGFLTIPVDDATVTELTFVRASDSYVLETATYDPASLTRIANAVWSTTTRTLTSFGTLITDIWAATTRSLTDKAGFSLTTAPPTASTIAAAVWGAGARTLTAFGFSVSANNLPTDYAKENTLTTAASAIIAKTNLLGTASVASQNDVNTKGDEILEAIETSGGGFTEDDRTKLEYIHDTVEMRLGVSEELPEGPVVVLPAPTITNFVTVYVDTIPARAGAVVTLVYSADFITVDSKIPTEWQETVTTGSDGRAIFQTAPSSLVKPFKNNETTHQISLVYEQKERKYKTRVPDAGGNIGQYLVPGA